MVTKPKGIVPAIYINSYNYVNRTKYTDIEIILEDVEFAWRKSDIQEVIKLWGYGIPLKKISERINRDLDEVFLLLLHLARNGTIKKRENFIWGNDYEL